MKFFFLLLIFACGPLEDAAEKAGSGLNPNVRVSPGTYQGQDVLVVKCMDQDTCERAMAEACPGGYEILPAPEKDSVYWQYRFVFRCTET